jgi:hypothetical protein
LRQFFRKHGKGVSWISNTLDLFRKVYEHKDSVRVCA